MAIQPTAAPWFIPQGPQATPEFAQFMAVIEHSDTETQNIGMNAHVEKVTGFTMDDMMEASLHETAVIFSAATSGPVSMRDAPTAALGASAWMTGFGSGLRNSRGRELPDEMPSPEEMRELVFGDIDPEVVIFVASLRTSVLTSDDADEIRSLVSSEIGLIASVASLWLDGLVIGLLYDTIVEGGN
jgi:hypothetical protein